MESLQAIDRALLRGIEHDPSACELRREAFAQCTALCGSEAPVVVFHNLLRCKLIG